MCSHGKQTKHLYLVNFSHKAHSLSIQIQRTSVDTEVEEQTRSGNIMEYDLISFIQR